MIWLKHTCMEDRMDSHGRTQFQLRQLQLKGNFSHFTRCLELAIKLLNQAFVQLPLGSEYMGITLNKLVLQP